MKLGELFIDLGFDVDEGKLKDFNDKINAARNDMLKMSAVATGAVYALNAFMENSALHATNIRNFTQQFGESSRAIQEWQTVIAETNPAVSIDQAAEAYKRLASALVDVRFGGGPSGALSMLGIGDPANIKDADTALREIASHIKQTIQTYGVGGTSKLLDEVGIGRDSLQSLLLLNKNPGEFDRLGAKGIVSDENIDKAKSYAKAIADLSVEWRTFSTNITAIWAPNLIAALKFIEKESEEWVPKIDKAAQALGGWKVVGEVVLAFFVGKWTIGMLAAIGRVAAAFTVANAGFAIAEGAGAAIGGAAVAGATAFAVAAPFAGYAANEYGKWNGKGWAEHLADFLQPVGKPGLFDQPGAWLGGQFSGSAPAQSGAEYLMKNGKTDSGTSITNNNTFHITTNGDATDTAKETARALQRQNDSAFQQLNLGPRY